MKLNGYVETSGTFMKAGKPQKDALYVNTLKATTKPGVKTTKVTFQLRMMIR